MSSNLDLPVDVLLLWTCAEAIDLPGNLAEICCATETGTCWTSRIFKTFVDLLFTSQARWKLCVVWAA